MTPSFWVVGALSCLVICVLRTDSTVGARGEIDTSQTRNWWDHCHPIKLNDNVIIIVNYHAFEDYSYNPNNS